MTDDKAPNFAQDALNFHYQECQRLTAQLAAAHAAATEWQARAVAAEAENAKLRGIVARAKRYHFEDSEICWRSCPKSGDYCGDEPEPGLECNCGATEWNAEIDAALSAAPAAQKETLHETAL